MPLDAAFLNQRVTLQMDVITFVKGVKTKVPTDYAKKVPANAKPLSGKEFWDAQQVNSKVNWKVTLRYRTDVLAQHRVIYGARKLQIISLLPDEERKESLVLMCEEVNG